MKIVITDRQEELYSRNVAYESELFKKELGEEIELIVHPYTQDMELLEVIKDADGILTAYINLDESILRQCTKLKAISITATGFNNVDLKTCDEKKTAVCAIGEYCTREVADHTMSFILNLYRNIKIYDEQIQKEKKWIFSTCTPPSRIEGQVLGIIGFGKIGKAVSRRALAFGFQVIANDPKLTDEVAGEYGVKKVSLEEIFDQSDIITNHMDANETNLNFFNRDKFSKFKKKPFFINTARGICMVEKDVAEALDKGWIKGAALDVLEEENPDLYKCKLLNRDNVILTPHSAFYSKEAFSDLENISVMNLVYCVLGQLDKAFKIVNNPY